MPSFFLTRIIILSALLALALAGPAAAAPAKRATKKTAAAKTTVVPKKTPAIPAAAKKPPRAVLPNGSKYSQKTITTDQGNFKIDLITIPLTDKIKIIADTAATTDCKNNCPAKTLKNYASDNAGFAAIHGAYFCPPDYTPCKNTVNQFGAPFYSDKLKYLFNADKIQWFQGGALIFDQNNRPYFFASAKDFGSIAQFESTHQTKIQALIGNYPSLIDNGKNIVASQTMDEKQRTAKGLRGGIGVAGNTVYLVVARGATVVDLAAVMAALKVDYALNLDGGASAGLYFDGAHKITPRRLLPTAIVFAEVK